MEEKDSTDAKETSLPKPQANVDISSKESAGGSKLPFYLSITGNLLAVIALIYAMNAKSGTAANAEALSQIKVIDEKANELVIKVDGAVADSSDLAKSNNALALQVDKLKKDIARLQRDTQEAFVSVATEFQKLQKPAPAPAPTTTASSTTSSSPQPAPGPGGEYTIQAGDTISGIASKMGIANWQQIIDANPGINPNRLRVGQKIKLP